ncbi:sugar phosphate isomerase/epimerase family protein [Candidatus Latescibacterota bacterium]
MSPKMNRRSALGAGIAAGGTMMGTSNLSDVHAWPPGPDEIPPKKLQPGSTPVRLGAYMGRQEGEGLTEMIKRFREAGTSGTMANAEAWLAASDSDVTEFKAALEKYDVAVFEVPGYTNMIDPSPTKRQRLLKKITECIEAAERIGCPMVGTISGSCDPVKWINVHPDNWTAETWKLLVESCNQVLRDTAGMKAALGMEAQVTTNIDGPEAHKRLIEDVGPRCMVNFDPANMISLANYYHTTDLINRSFDLLGETIIGAHAKDTVIWPDTQTVHVQEVCPGRGVMDFETYLIRLSRMDWPRTLCPEHLPEDQYPEAREHIRTVAAKAGVTIL